MLLTQEKQWRRDSSAMSRSFVVSFFTQRTPQTKTNIMETTDGFTDGTKSKSSMRFWWVQRFHFLQLDMNNRFLQPPEEGLLRGGCHNKMILWNWPKKTLMLYYVLLQLTCSCYCCWPSSFLPSRVASKRAQGFSSEVDILESIRHVFFQRQVCIWNKCARDHFSRKFLFAL